MDLDSIDIAILRSLQADARASLRTVAKHVGVSVPTVSARLVNLETLGIVAGYRALLDPGKLDETTMTLVVKTKPQAAEIVAREIAGHDWARRILLGRPGWVLVEATVARREDADAVLEDVSSIHDVTDCQDYLCLRVIKDEPRALLADRQPASVTCYECRGPIQGDPVKVRLDGRTHYFCCHSCERLYLERYRKIQAAAKKRV